MSNEDDGPALRSEAASLHDADDAVPDEAGEVEITRMALRGGGWIGYSEDAVFVVDGDDRIKVPKDAVEGLALRTLEFDVAVMSLLLVGVGVYVALERNPLVGVAFAAVGVYSSYRTYQQRYELVVDVENEPKPLSVHPEHPKECHRTLVEEVRDH
ncbi:MAG: hypothetical protein ABEH83_14885 [Halobacterium sp.]